MDRATVIERNRVELGRLRDLLGRLSDEELALPLEGGWSVGSTLAHLAFWDQRAVFLLERWEQQGVGPSQMDVDILNRACLPQWRALAPRVAADLTLKTAEAIDKKIETVSAEIFDWCLTNSDCPINIERAKHRAEHIEQIQEAVKSKK
jgi:hypothetical protein